jgi:hypothetical protein
VALSALPLLARRASDFQPQVVLDLRHFGYEVPSEARGKRIFATPNQTLTFIDDHTLAISLFVRNPHPGLSVRDSVFGGWYLFQTTFLDARSGKVLRTQTWSNSTVHSGIFASPGRGFVVWRDLTLSLHAPDGTTLKTLSMDAKDFPRGISVRQSPSGETLFAEFADRSGNHIVSIRTEDLQKLSRFDLPGYFDDAGSDSYFVFIRSHPQSLPPIPMDLFVGNMAHQEPTFLPTPIFTAEPGCLYITFLDDRTLGVSGRCGNLTILDVSGEVLFHRQFEKALTGGMIGCRNCDLVVSDTFALKGGSDLLDIPQHSEGRSLLFLNLKTKKLVEVPHPARATHSSSMALSPNGCLLAIEKDSNLEIYEICNSAIATDLQ